MPYHRAAMTSLRKRKKQASRQGLPVPALELLELVEELLDAHRWLQVLGYANQFVLNEKLQIAPEERDRVLEAATRAVDKDARLADWRQRAAQLRVELGAVAAELPPPEPVAQPKPGLRDLLPGGRPHRRLACGSLAFCDEVVVVDSGSTDGTRELAEPGSARASSLNKPFPGHREQKQFAIEQARTTWCSASTPTNAARPALRRRCALRRAGLRAPAYEMPRHNHYLGRIVRHGLFVPDRKVRLFDRRRRGGAGATRTTTSSRRRARVERLGEAIEHLSYRDFAHHLRTIDSFTAIAARALAPKGAGPTCVRPAGAPAGGVREEPRAEARLARRLARLRDRGDGRLHRLEEVLAVVAPGRAGGPHEATRRRCASCTCSPTTSGPARPIRRSAPPRACAARPRRGVRAGFVRAPRRRAPCRRGRAGKAGCRWWRARTAQALPRLPSLLRDVRAAPRDAARRLRAAALPPACRPPAGGAGQGACRQGRAAACSCARSTTPTHRSRPGARASRSGARRRAGADAVAARGRTLALRPAAERVLLQEPATELERNQVAGQPARALGHRRDHVLVGITARIQPHRRFELLWEIARAGRDRCQSDVRFVLLGRGNAEDTALVTEPIARLGLGQPRAAAGLPEGPDYDARTAQRSTCSCSWCPAATAPAARSATRWPWACRSW
jgi:hypothetical protein